jgi:leader peptidase (prepilin peptidase)/N-methyltransferase
LTIPANPTSVTPLNGDIDAGDEPAGWVPSGGAAQKSQDANLADDGEIIEEVITPWVPVILSPSVGYPTAGVALAAALGAWAANGHRGPITATLLSLLAAALVILAVIDARTLRLPDAIVLPFAAILSLGVIAAALAGEISTGATLIAFGCLAGGFALYWVLAVATGGLGYGDVKLAGVMALGIGLIGWVPALFGTVVLPFALGGVVSMVLIVAGKRDLGIPFGPFMSAGGLLMLIAPGVLGAVAGL